jgi:hypothetical protein
LFCGHPRSDLSGFEFFADVTDGGTVGALMVFVLVGSLTIADPVVSPPHGGERTRTGHVRRMDWLATTPPR